MESSEINASAYGQLGSIYSGEKKVISISGFGKWTNTCKRMKLEY